MMSFQIINYLFIHQRQRQSSDQTREPALCQLYRHTFVPYTTTLSSRYSPYAAFAYWPRPIASDARLPKHRGLGCGRQLRTQDESPRQALACARFEANSTSTGEKTSCYSNGGERPHRRTDRSTFFCRVAPPYSTSITRMVHRALASLPPMGHHLDRFSRFTWRMIFTVQYYSLFNYF